MLFVFVNESGDHLHWTRRGQRCNRI